MELSEEKVNPFTLVQALNSGRLFILYLPFIFLDILLTFPSNVRINFAILRLEILRVICSSFNENLISIAHLLFKHKKRSELDK